MKPEGNKNGCFWPTKHCSSCDIFLVQQELPPYKNISLAMLPKTWSFCMENTKFIELTRKFRVSPNLTWPLPSWNMLEFGMWKSDFHRISGFFCVPSLAGWWFGTFFFPYIWNVIIPTDFHIFQRGFVNHQPAKNHGSLRSFSQAKGYAANEVMLLGEAGKQVQMMNQILGSMGWLTLGLWLTVRHGKSTINGGF